MSNEIPNAEALTKLTQLAAEARGGEIVHLSAPDGVKGVPSTIPALKIAGATPQLVNVQGLFEHWRTKPSAKRGVARALTLDSFIALTVRHKTGHSALFADTTWTKPGLTAVIDYHEAVNGGEPDNGKHRVAYEFPLSEEWKAWVQTNGEPFKQIDFAAFIEDRIAELTAPTPDEASFYEDLFATRIATPAELVTLSRGLQVNVDSRVKNASVLQTGAAQIVFEEEHRDANGNVLKVPGLFMLAVAPFFMGEKARIPVRLRYRVSGGSILWFYQIYRPDLAVTQRVREDLPRAAEQTELPAFEAAPEMSA
ncbi:DUF2303 family protein [Rhodoblastus sp. 17X3]|uniref:DUF2303 family protein n=1 Tax=Rhodoblastus sp. 17X3 TaxID=3047026 RepID=UPI0024B74AE7|nr:DUF2303 family protein [Rhodoblastus sp. 17X3]MDI9847332.1 DUF2303 family protein [Rhodoblastus sp. 17X3]